MTDTSREALIHWQRDRAKKYDWQGYNSLGDLFRATADMLEADAQEIKRLEQCRIDEAKTTNKAAQASRDLLTKTLNEAQQVAARPSAEVRFGGRCDKHPLQIKPCQVCVSAQQVAVPAWTPTAERMPEPCAHVLAYNGKRELIRAMWVPAKTLEASGDGDFGEYDEATDEMWWPQGWYETNAYEETHWMVDGPVTHWMPLPTAPQGDKP